MEKSPKVKIFQPQVRLSAEQEEKRNKTKATEDGDGPRECIGSPQGGIRAHHFQIPYFYFIPLKLSAFTAGERQVIQGNFFKLGKIVSNRKNDLVAQLELGE